MSLLRITGSQVSFTKTSTKRPSTSYRDCTNFSHLLDYQPGGPPINTPGISVAGSSPNYLQETIYTEGELSTVFGAARSSSC